MEQHESASAKSTAGPAQAANLATVARQLDSGTPLDAAGLLRAEAACLCLFQDLCVQASRSSDPRLALAHAHFAEAFSRQATRTVITAASLVETTAAHALDLAEFDHLRAGTTDFSAPPRFAPGRTLYLDAATVLSQMLDVNYFEADRRVKDAHLVHARKDIAGAACAPRFTLLAEHFAGPAPSTAASICPAGWALPGLHSAPDPREVLKTARALDKFEPEDSTFDGLPTTATAKAADGTLLEEHAAAHLKEDQIRIRQKRINGLIKDYKDAHDQSTTPKLGLFRGKVVNGVHEFIVRVRELDAELWESLITQADNKRTKAGAAARKAAGTASEDAPGHRPPGDSPSGQDHGNTGEPSASGPPTGGHPGQTGAEADGVPEPDGDQQAQDGKAGWETPADHLWHGDQPPPDWACVGLQAPPDDAGPDPNPPDTPPPGIPATCSVPERRLNALNAILRNIGPDCSGKRITPEIVVHARFEDLQDLASLTGISAHGVKISAPQLRTMLCEAKVLSPIYNADGVIMDIGRDARLFPRWMKLAARDRDGGCLVPGCTADPALIEFHHFKPWAKGGHTRLQDCCPLCALHHTMVHSGYLKLVKIKGLPYVILPKHLDPQQLPRRNTYFART
ncbi:hypothetical protein [Glutamicibacter sp.]|uniref:HNH endonuclease signature motif containing protein n=1 Tax=Glutamicibacter sp. TaxID=1931995 RepID=UPI003D6C2151